MQTSFLSFFIDSDSAVECDKENAQVKLTKNKHAHCSNGRNQYDFPMTKNRKEMKKNVNAMTFLGSAILLRTTWINVTIVIQVSVHNVEMHCVYEEPLSPDIETSRRYNSTSKEYFFFRK